MSSVLPIPRVLSTTAAPVGVPRVIFITAAPVGVIVRIHLACMIVELALTVLVVYVVIIICSSRRLYSDSDNVEFEIRNSGQPRFSFHALQQQHPRY
mmetsp:Transcript_15341/g.30953  ORF Transcript_15341/g.30953 Transcript_15341/m.30953 type:complete len:97 (+) Transcript_15341:1016-1306(+)